MHGRAAHQDYVQSYRRFAPIEPSLLTLFRQFSVKMCILIQCICLRSLSSNLNLKTMHFVKAACRDVKPRRRSFMLREIKQAIGNHYSNIVLVYPVTAPL
jgi:hypothetical protein